MTKITISYHDITRNPDATRRANHGPALRDALLSAGFTPLGVVEERSPTDFTPEQRAKLMQTPDGREILNTLENGNTIEVLSSPDRRAFGIVERYIGGPVVFVSTILEDGTIVETTTGPKRPPELSKPPTTPMADVAQRLSRFIAGGTLLWHRASWPGAGFILDVVPTDDPLVIWQQHQRRLDATLRDPARRVRAHSTLDLYIAMCQRSNEILETKERWQFLAMGCFMSVGTLLAMYLLVQFFVPALETTSAALFGNTILGRDILPMLATVPFFFLVASRIRPLARWFVPLLPGPKRRPVPELLGETAPNKHV